MSDATQIQIDDLREEIRALARNLQELRDELLIPSLKADRPLSADGPSQPTPIHDRPPVVLDF